MPLVRGPIAIRCPRRPDTDRIGDWDGTMKNSGPAFIGAAMARSIDCANGGLPFLARPIQFEAMKPSSISPALRRLAFSVLADFDSSTSTRAAGDAASNSALSACPWLWNVPSRSDVPIRMIMDRSLRPRSTCALLYHGIGKNDAVSRERLDLSPAQSRLERLRAVGFPAGI